MRTIHVTFKVDGKTIKRTAILSNDLSELSKSKKNQCGDIIEDTYNDGYWSLIFFESETKQYEVELEFDIEEWQKTIKPVKCIVWENDVIVDEVNVLTKENKKRCEYVFKIGDTYVY